MSGSTSTTLTSPSAIGQCSTPLGTTNSWIYQSEDGGASWQRLAKLAKTDDLLVDNILVDESDPKTLLVGTWVVDHPDGGLFMSHDAGKSWTAVEGMKGQSIRALSQAPSDPKIIIAGTLNATMTMLALRGPTRSAVASSYSTWHVGLPRRKTSSSMQGRSSCTSEYA